MTQILNFDKFRPPILTVRLMDEKQTELNVTLPTVALQEELRSRMREITTMLNSEGTEQREALFDLAARLMSCNRNMRTIAGRELGTVYGLDEEDLVVFFSAYTDFVTGVERLKN